MIIFRAIIWKSIFCPIILCNWDYRNVTVPAPHLQMNILRSQIETVSLPKGELLEKQAISLAHNSPFLQDAPAMYPRIYQRVERHPPRNPQWLTARRLETSTKVQVNMLTKTPWQLGSNSSFHSLWKHKASYDAFFLMDSCYGVSKSIVLDSLPMNYTIDLRVITWKGCVMTVAAEAAITFQTISPITWPKEDHTSFCTLPDPNSLALSHSW